MLRIGTGYEASQGECFVEIGGGTNAVGMRKRGEKDGVERSSDSGGQTCRCESALSEFPHNAETRDLVWRKLDGWGGGRLPRKPFQYRLHVHSVESQLPLLIPKAALLFPNRIPLEKSVCHVQRPPERGRPCVRVRRLHYLTDQILPGRDEDMSTVRKGINAMYGLCSDESSLD